MGNVNFAEYRYRRQEKEEKRVREIQEKTCQRFRDLAVWLQAANISDDHMRLTRSQSTGTGRWLFGKPEFIKWFDPASNQVPLLWMNGKPCTGKSILASMVVQEAMDTLADQAKVLYFYCKADDKERSNFLAISRSFLSQLLSHDPQTLDHLWPIYQQSTETVLRTRHIIENALKKALNTCPRTYIVIDGLNECSKDDRSDIVSWFRHLVEILPPEDSAQHRVLFVSQDDADAQRDFSGMHSLYIQTSDNSSDIAQFGKQAAEKIQQRFDVTDEMRENIAFRIPEACDGEIIHTLSARFLHIDVDSGNFLMAKLIWDNLYDQACLQDLEAELVEYVFPMEINEV